MWWTRLFAVAVVLVCVLSACTKHQPVAPPNKRVNPNQSERYRILLTFIDDPGASIRIEGEATYAIAVGSACLPVDYTRSLGGSKPIFESERRKLDVRRVADDSYAATIYLDHLIDEDYYGLGVCHWKPRAYFKLETMHNSSLFSLSDTEVAGESSRILFCDTSEPSRFAMSCVPEAAIGSRTMTRYFRVQVQTHRE